MAVPVIEDYTEQWNTTGSTTLTFAKPDGVQAGELLLIIAINDDTSTTAFLDSGKPSGWTFIGQFGNGTSDSHVGLFWKIATGGEGENEVVTSTGADEWGGWYVRISGVDTDTPINSVGVQTTVTGSSVTAASINTDVDDCLALCFGSFDGGDGNNSAPFGVSGTGWSYEDDGSSGTDGSSDCSGVWGKKAMPSAGATGNATISSDGTSDGMVGVQIAIAPGASGPETHQLSGSTDSVSLLSGTMTVTRKIVGTVVTVSLLAAALSVMRPIEGSADSVSLLSGELTVSTKHQLEGSADSVSALSGAIGITRELAGAADSAGLVSGALIVTRDLAGASDSTSLLSGAIDVTREIAGASDSASLLSGVLTVIPAGGETIPLAGTSDSVSLLAGALDVTRDIAGSVHSVSLLSGDLTIVGGGAPIPLAGSIDSASLLAGDVLIIRGMAGAVASDSALSGSLNVTRDLAGCAGSISFLSGSLDIPHTIALAGSIASHSNVRGYINVGIYEEALPRAMWPPARKKADSPVRVWIRP